MLVWKLDRLARNPIDQGQISWLLQQGIIGEIRTPFNSYFPKDNVLMSTVEFGMATQYSRDLSENVKRGNETKLQSGGLPGRAPIGYLNDTSNHTVVMDAKTAPIITEAFHLYATGNYNTRSIADYIFDHGIKTGSGKKYTRSMIDHVLRNPFYYGQIKRKDVLYAGNHKPLISRALFDDVQTVLSGKSVVRKSKHFFPIRGFASCAFCGCSITGEVQRGIKYFHCTNGKKNCDQKSNFVRGNILDEMVASVLGELETDPEMIELSYSAAKEMYINNTDLVKTKIQHLKNEVLDSKNKLNKILDYLTDGVITKEVYKSKSEALEANIKSTEEEIFSLSNGNIKDALVTFEQTKKALLQAHYAKDLYLNGDDYKKRELLEILLSNIAIADKKVQSYRFKTEFQLVSEVPKNASLYYWLGY